MDHDVGYTTCFIEEDCARTGISIDTEDDGILSFTYPTLPIRGFERNSVGATSGSGAALIRRQSICRSGGLAGWMEADEVLYLDWTDAACLDWSNERITSGDGTGSLSIQHCICITGKRDSAAWRIQWTACECVIREDQEKSL